MHLSSVFSAKIMANSLTRWALPFLNVTATPWITSTMVTTITLLATPNSTASTPRIMTLEPTGFQTTVPSITPLQSSWNTSYTSIGAANRSTVTVTVTNSQAPSRTSSCLNDHSPAISSTVFMETHRVQVGADGDLIFRPQTIDAAVGDMILFEFLAKNHTVTRSSFDNPCVPNQGLDSGFQFFNPTNQTGIINQRLPYLVRDSEPTWFFCRQSSPRSHCNAGMVFAINAGDLFGEFLQIAEEASPVSIAFATASTTTSISKKGTVSVTSGP